MELQIFREALNTKQLLPKPRHTITDVPNDMGLCNARKYVRGRLLACHPDAAGNLPVERWRDRLARHPKTLLCSEPV
jgi:hypothetical protein